MRVWLLSILLMAGVMTGLLKGEAAGAAAGETPQHDNVVISEFRTRGPLPGGAGDEFVELFNPTNSDVNIGDWKIRYSYSCSDMVTTPLVTILSDTILAPGQHYLVTAASGSSVSGADQTFTIALEDQGGLALVNKDDVIVDQVGMCVSIAYLEGTPLSPLTVNANRSYERKPGGSLGSCTDTDNNAADFQLRSSGSDPQHFSSPYTTACIGKLDQTISFTSSVPVNAAAGGTYSPTAAATSGLEVAITIDATASSVCSISGTGVVSFTATGTCVIDANQAGDGSYNAAPQVQQSIPVKNNQTIGFTSTAPANAEVGGTYAATATATSGLGVTLTIDTAASSICSISGTGVVSFTANGTCVIDANQAGNASYNAAPQAQQSFVIGTTAQSDHQL